jgi:hypothetical protein
MHAAEREDECPACFADRKRAEEDYKGNGGEGGILLPPFLLSSCDLYTSAIIACA